LINKFHCGKLQRNDSTIWWCRNITRD